jgi:high affinity choline transporter 7
LQAGDREILWIMRLGIVLVGAAASVMAIVVNSIYGLWYLCGDLVYVILFPQLTCALFLPFANTYGALVGWIIGLVMRLMGGEPLLGLPPLIKYPNYDEESGYQLTPFKTISMLISLTTIILISGLTHLCFTRNILSAKADVFHCYNDADPDFYSINMETVPDKEKQAGVDNPTIDNANANDNAKNTYTRTVVY